MSLLCVTKGRYMRKCLDGMIVYIILIVRMLTFTYRWEISNCTLISLNILLLFVVLESNSRASNRQSKCSITELHPQLHICVFYHIYVYIYIYTCYIYTHIHTDSHTDTLADTHICICICIYYLYYTYIYICKYIWWLLN
jgi:hypothetical protein